MRILLVNDDGVYAPGYRELARRLAEKHEVLCVAPDGNRSAVSHGLTNRIPLFAREVELGEGLAAQAVSGTPADCTRLALTYFCREKPDLVISGPNEGYNTGHDLFYSGTVAAALEGAMHGVKAIVVSGPPHGDARNAQNCVPPEETVAVFLELLEQIDVERDIACALNINLPNCPREQIKGVAWVPQSLEFHWYDEYERRVSPEGREYWWISGTEKAVGREPVDDLSAVVNGYVAVTPIHFSLTNRQAPWGKEFRL